MPDIIWVLIGLLLFALLLSIGFNTTLGDFIKTKFARTVACLAVGIGGCALFSVCLADIIKKGNVLSQQSLISTAIGAVIGGSAAASAILIYFYKVKNMKPVSKKR